jgi:UDP-N-acetylglucosamine--N-acetylmuramyl-(pentapeptide) pyrophosphoryl-undecaprenol N-acetylglucosamine transferase
VRIAFAGGGTGGHLFPGLAVAEIVRRRELADEIVFFGASRGIETVVVPREGYELVSQALEGVRGRGSVASARALALLGRAIAAARRELVRRRIDVVVGLGGYASTAAVIAARSARIPVVLLEQNRELGLATRVLSRLAAAVCTSFEDTASALPRGRARWTGNPVRPALEEAFSRREKTRDALLVFGGSAGAQSVNRAVIAALGDIRRRGRCELPTRIIHQAGRQGLDEVRAAYRSLGLVAEVHEFIDDMAAAYAAARVAVCRAGATTVAELAATGTPAILIPFPHAAAHQLANALAVESAGAGQVVRDGPSTATELADALVRLLADRATLDSLGAAAAKLGRPGAAGRVVDVVAAVAKGRASR